MKPCGVAKLLQRDVIHLLELLPTRVCVHPLYTSLDLVKSLKRLIFVVVVVFKPVLRFPFFFFPLPGSHLEPALAGRLLRAPRSSSDVFTWRP